MKCNLHFYLLNEHFSQEYADLHHGGRDSEMNRRYEWEDELSVTTGVDKVEVHAYAVYPLQGTMPDGTPFSHEVKDMRLFELISGDTNTVVGCSESVLDSYSLEQSDEGFELSVYLKDYEPMGNPVPGIYIAAQEFPKELVF